MRSLQTQQQAIVAPHAGAWIETHQLTSSDIRKKSHPMRVRGLKLFLIRFVSLSNVAPHAGAWIETLITWRCLRQQNVAPHAGAWIETFYFPSPVSSPSGSHPMRVRGLKR